MASVSSSSSFSDRHSYHVFPSFCGEDVRRNFLSHLHKELQHNGIDAFKDGGIKRSRSIWPELKQAIWESKIFIVVLSKNYAGSCWCLDELVEIMECREVVGKTLVPIFYDVDPSSVRKQTGDFGKAFDKICDVRTEEERQRWRQALTNVGNIAGECSSKWDNDAKMIEKIVAYVSEELFCFTSSTDFEDLLGLEAHVANLKSMLGLESNEGSYRRKEIDGYSMKLHLRERFLSEITTQRKIKVSHLGVAQERLKNQKALIVLDDVDELEQLRALADQTQWVGNGTRILVTTEDRQLLKAHGITHVYEVDYPSRDEALKILCQCAFGKNSAPEGYNDLAVEVVELAGYLPLGLSVLGASLRGMSKKEWINALPRLRTSLNGKIEKLLRVCYEGLDEKDKAIFLHIACLFNGKNVDRVKLLLAKSALDVEFGLKVLVDRSRIHIDADGYIVMHCLLQQLGKEITRGQCLDEPGKRKFLVDSLEISDVLADETGTETVLGISLDMSEIEDQVYVSEKAFEKMPNLQFLWLYKNFPDEAVKLYLPHGLDYLPRKLRLLHWDSYPKKCLPSKFRPEFLVELTMRDSKLEKLWEGIQPLKSLKRMELSASTKIKDIPNLSRATNLEKLYLRFCKNLVIVPSSCLQNLHKLKVLDMSCCIKLKSLPDNINLKSLSVLNMRGCSKLNNFPLISTQIQFMSLGETAIEKVPSVIKLCSRLVSLEMAGCKNLKTLPYLPASIEIVDI
ncbi:unnamed protein product [Arabidopsis thaliana]|uniref:ADP-ribosyl cyclase/cyclic ADP-ribose hydrolase n=1 Tax=Arabidopsis thaliana TaxID=3702 RepID=A0A5S9Y5R7_ARATH|nr:unnamed protein product [Arabidopsis thaliana]